MQTISITNKWQINIPVSVREKLDMDKPSSAKIEATKDGRIIITPIKSEIFKFAGKYQEEHKKTKVNIDKIRDHIDYSES